MSLLQMLALIKKMDLIDVIKLQVKAQKDTDYLHCIGVFECLDLAVLS